MINNRSGDSVEWRADRAAAFLDHRQEGAALIRAERP